MIAHEVRVHASADPLRAEDQLSAGEIVIQNVTSTLEGTAAANIQMYQIIGMKNILMQNLDHDANYDAWASSWTSFALISSSSQDITIRNNKIRTIGFQPRFTVSFALLLVPIRFFSGPVPPISLIHLAPLIQCISSHRRF